LPLCSSQAGLWIRDIGALESAIAQPRMGFGSEDLYPKTIDKTMAICYSLVMNHPFVDGNKRIGHAAMEVFLLLNDHITCFKMLLFVQHVTIYSGLGVGPR